MSRRLAVGLLAIGLLVISASALPSAAVAAAPDADRTIRDPRITESSGLAVSPAHPGVLWTHDDSGNPPLLFALAPSGRVAGTVRIAGVPDLDWEAMAAFRDRTGQAWLAAADVGDNDTRRSSVEVDVVAEPGRLGTDVQTPRLRLRLRYPDGPRDAETLLVDPVRGRMFVVSKGLLSGTVYAVPPSAWDGRVPGSAATRSATLVAVGTVPLILVTDGTVAPDGTVLLRTYGDLAAFDPFPLDGPSGGATRLLVPRATASLPEQRQGEGLALAPDLRSVLVSSEGTGQPVLRVVLPDDIRTLLAPASPAATPTPSPAAATTPGRPGSHAAPAAAGDGDLVRVGALTGAAIAGCAGVAALAAAAVLGLRRGARRRSRRSP